MARCNLWRNMQSSCMGVEHRAFAKKLQAMQPEKQVNCDLHRLPEHKTVSIAVANTSDCIPGAEPAAIAALIANPKNCTATIGCYSCSNQRYARTTPVWICW